MNENTESHEIDDAFLKRFQNSKLEILDTMPQTGPDGWPYLLVEMNSSASEDATKVLDWLSDKGIGVVVNPKNDTPDYVLTYGMI